METTKTVTLGYFPHFCIIADKATALSLKSSNRNVDEWNRRNSRATLIRVVKNYKCSPREKPHSVIAFNLKGFSNFVARLVHEANRCKGLWPELEELGFAHKYGEDIELELDPYEENGVILLELGFQWPSSLKTTEDEDGKCPIGYPLEGTS